MRPEVTPATVQIPRVDLLAQREGLRSELEAAVERVLASGHFILGPEVEAFEAEFAAYCGVEHCVGTGSGTEALQLTLAACGVGAGDEVVTVSQTAVPTVFAAQSGGATPVFADVQRDTFTIDPARAADAVGPATRALLPVHLYGQCANIDPLRELAEQHGLRLIEDACQAHGATYRGQRAGSLGHAGCFSFYPTKNLGGYGDGGAVCTDDGELADRVRLLRNHGLTHDYQHAVAAGNSRLDELQAAMLRVKLGHLDEWNRRRRLLAGVYAEHLGDTPVTLPRAAEWGEHVYHLYVICTPRRDELRAYLRDNGVDAGVHYPVPAHQQAAFAHLPARADLPVTESVAGELLSLPMYPELAEEQATRVASLVRDFFG
jgi:dTDP-4-amino-4,6-dideoxygalactose transaminase